jgi:hypothetical protein
MPANAEQALRLFPIVVLTGARRPAIAPFGNMINRVEHARDGLTRHSALAHEFRRRGGFGDATIASDALCSRGVAAWTTALKW